ncbi:MAG: glyoxylate carboligase [Deltaproteobacteria bacterium HGW-Deltaproteobacteria-21]|nr:MAG: glyoxylate carboligase [Deltaproteobacteria bacterium HGW-Deltaproteobacteria-21]
MAAAVRILESEGVKYIFGIPGAGILPFYKALRDLGTIKHMVTRHEESAIHMADGYARALGTVGVCAATSGPGASNFVTGLYTAQVDSIPLLALTGQNTRAQLDREAFQAVNIAEVVKPVVKKSYCIKDPAMVPWVFREAFKIMREGRPGPVLIDLPLDVQKEDIEFDPEVDSPLPILRTPPNLKQIQKAADMLLSADRPVMLLGGGVIIADACKEFVELAEMLQIPVVSSYMGKSGIPWNHPLMAGHVGIQCNTRSGNQVFLESTMVLAIGARFNDRHTGDLKVYKGERKFIHVDVDPGQLGKNIMPDLGICADAKLTLQALLEEMKRRKVKPHPKKIDIAQIRHKLERKTDYDNVPIKPQRVFKEINEFFDEETVFVTCIGLNQIWSGQLQKISKPRHYLDCGGAGPLGWDMPASIGAKIARPDKVVVDVVGDFGFQFCMDALPVAVMYKIPFVIVVLNNGYLGLIRQAEKYGYDMDFEVQIWYDSLRAIQAEQTAVRATAGAKVSKAESQASQAAENEGKGFDFVKFAQACGAMGERVTDPNEIKAALKRGVESGVPYVVDIIMERDTDCSMGVAIDSIREFV